jgi:dihydropteroate synthase
MYLTLPRARLDLEQACVMGVLNVTPDSFSDGGQYPDTERAVSRALEMVEQGARMLDIGGESTRPGASPVSATDEIARVVPVVEEICRQTDVPVSVDTSKPEVMAAALASGAAMINDVRGLESEGALEAVAATDAAVCIMHMQGEPRTMQSDPVYSDVVADIRAYLLARAAVCEAAGIDSSRIVIDPGFGFGKRLSHNIAIMKQLSDLADAGYPLLIGISRKSMIGKLLDREVDQRLAGGLALTAVARQSGARIFRTHDVAETVDVLRIIDEFVLSEQAETVGSRG